MSRGKRENPKSPRLKLFDIMTTKTEFSDSLHDRNHDQTENLRRLLKDSKLTILKIETDLEETKKRFTIATKGYIKTILFDLTKAEILKFTLFGLRLEDTEANRKKFTQTKRQRIEEIKQELKTAITSAHKDALSRELDTLFDALD